MDMSIGMVKFTTLAGELYDFGFVVATIIRIGFQLPYKECYAIILLFIFLIR